MASSLVLLALLVAFAAAHIEITYPTVGVRPLAADNTTPCSGTNPTSPRYQLQLATTLLLVSVYSSNTHAGGSVSLALGWGSNPTTFPYLGPTGYLNSANPGVTFNFSVPWNASLGSYGTVQVYFTGGDNYQCLDLQWAGTTAPPSPTPPSPSPTPPPSPYAPLPLGVIGRSFNPSYSAAYWHFTSPSSAQKFCGWENGLPWNTLAAWFNSATGSYDSVFPSPNTSDLLLADHAFLGSYSFGVCPHNDTANRFLYAYSIRGIRVIPTSTPNQVVALCYCSSCSSPTLVYSVNSLNATAKQLATIAHVYASSPAGYDYANGITAVADASFNNVWFYNANFDLFGLSNFTGMIDSFIFMRISAAKNKTYVLGSKNKLASTLYVVDLSKNGALSSVTLTNNTIAQYSSVSSPFSYVVDDANNLIWGTYLSTTSPSYVYGVFSINVLNGVVQASAFDSLDPAGLILVQ